MLLWIIFSVALVFSACGCSSSVKSADGDNPGGIDPNGPGAERSLKRPIDSNNPGAPRAPVLRSVPTGARPFIDPNSPGAEREIVIRPDKAGKNR
jgi:hypothetical protein